MITVVNLRNVSQIAFPAFLKIMGFKKCPGATTWIETSRATPRFLSLLGLKRTKNDLNLQ